MDENFLLKSETAQILYHQYAEGKPIYDYHCHLSPKDIWEDREYESITQLWLGEDHYKWRLMRLNGIEEKYITGDGSNYEKFLAYARTIERSIGNPLYHWTHLELQRYFGIYEPLRESTASAIFDKCNTVIRSGKFSVRTLLDSMNVAYVATTDDPIDSLEYHRKLADIDEFKVKIKPTFRPDRVVEISMNGFKEYIDQLGSITEIQINDVEALENALKKRIDYFNQVGCCIADHGISVLPHTKLGSSKVSEVFSKAMKGETLGQEEIDGYRSYVLVFLAGEYAKLGWTMQLHIGAVRNNSTKMFEKLGADKGFDSAGDGEIANALSRLLSEMENQGGLPKTVLYTLNPIHNYVMGTMLGNFSTDSMKGKIQFGAPWWFGDHKEGIEKHMIDLANLGILGNFIGMLTDSRSFLSMPRHEYFRRILCNLLGEWVENGELPNDATYLGEIVEDICYRNIQRYLEA